MEKFIKKWQESRGNDDSAEKVKPQMNRGSNFLGEL